MTIGTNGVVEDWNGEEWLDFAWAADEIADKLAMPPGPAQARLRKLCGSGEIRAIIREPQEEELQEEEPAPIPPSRWTAEAIDLTVPWYHLVAVSKSDFDHWLATAAGERRVVVIDKLQTKLVRDHEQWEWDFYGESWLSFERAIIELGDKLAIPPSAAQAQLHKLCASGQVRAIGTDDPDDWDAKPGPIPPSHWPDDDLPRRDVLVSNIDFYNRLERQLSPTAGGKQSRIVRLLGVLFPTGVPNRADCPREPLKADLIKRDPSHQPLDLKTLKTASDAYNRMVGNAGNASGSE
jgi:hypothetical protein